MKRKRGAPKAWQPKVSPRALSAAILAIDYPDIMRARLRDMKVTLTEQERKHLADDWQPKRKATMGRPKLPAYVAPVKSLPIAEFYIRTAYWGRKLGDHSGVPEAERATMRKFDIDRRTWDRHKEKALNWQDGKCLQEESRLARKKKRSI